MNILVKILCVCIFISLSSCSIKDVKKQISVDWRLKRFTIIADKDLNNGIPVAVDMLFIDDQTVLDSLTKLKALEWFSDRRDYIRKYRTHIKTISYELVPGQVIRDVDIPYSVSGDAISVLIFADYLNEGSFSSVIKQKSEVTIRLGPDDFGWSNSKE